LDKNDIRVNLREKRFKAGDFLGSSKPTDIKRQNDHKDTWVIGWPALRAKEVDKTISGVKEAGRLEGKGKSKGSKSRSTKEARPPSVAPGGILGSRALDFF
jgi:hypothetical protein